MDCSSPSKQPEHQGDLGFKKSYSNMDPIIEESNVLLTLEINEFLRSDDGVDRVVLSRYNNALNELKDGRVVLIYRFERPFAVVQQLNVFFSHEPKFKHYIFMNGPDLAIVRKSEETLAMHKTFFNISTYVIEDHLNIGKPQVVIYPVDDDPLIITDCNCDRLSPAGLSVVPALTTLIKKTKLCIKTAQVLLSQKRELLSKLSMSLAFNSSSDWIASTAGRLVLLREGTADGIIGVPVKKQALSIGTPWFRKHFSHWIIGFPVTNVTTEDMFDFQMYISHDNLSIEQTKLFRKASKYTEFYQEESKLPPGQCGVLVSVMAEPYLTLSSTMLRCICRYGCTSSDDLDQCYLGSLHIATPDLSTDKYHIGKPLSVTDSIAFRACSTQNELKFKPLTISKDEFIMKVESWNGFEAINRSAMGDYYHRFSMPMSSMVFNQTTDSIIFYTDTFNDFLLLVHNLICGFQGAVEFKHPKSDPYPAIEAMKKEISTIKDLLIQELCEPEEPAPQIHMGEVLRDLMLLEINSAVEMNELEDYENL